MKYDKHKVTKQVATNLKQLRKKKSYQSASQFAQAHSLPVQTYLNHENGKRGMAMATLLEYAHLLQEPYIKLLADIERCIFKES